MHEQVCSVQQPAGLQSPVASVENVCVQSSPSAVPANGSHCVPHWPPTCLPTSVSGNFWFAYEGKSMTRAHADCDYKLLSKPAGKRYDISKIVETDHHNSSDRVVYKTSMPWEGPAPLVLEGLLGLRPPRQQWCQYVFLPQVSPCCIPLPRCLNFDSCPAHTQEGAPWVTHAPHGLSFCILHVVLLVGPVLLLTSSSLDH